MKKLLALLLISSLHAQDAAKLIPPPQENPLPKPQPQTLHIAPEDIMSSKTITHEGQKFTIQKVEPQELPPLPPRPPAPKLTPEQIAERRARALELNGPQEFLMYSCTVFDGKFTRLQWTSKNTEPVQHYEAWSNVNFHHFSIAQFKKARTTYSLIFGIGDCDTAKMTDLYTRNKRSYIAPTIPNLPADPTTQPTYLITHGSPSEQDLAALNALHELYQNEHQTLKQTYQTTLTENAQRLAELKANPPNPKPDITIQYWDIKPEQNTAPANEGGLTQ